MEYLEEVKQKEDAVQVEMEKVYELVEKKEDFEKIKIIYNGYVKKVAELYNLFFQKIKEEKEKGEIDEGEWKKQGDFLAKKYKEEILLLAVAVDKVLGK